MIALIRRSPSTEEAREGLKSLLEIDDLQANAILDMQLRRLAALERQKIIDRLAELESIIADLEDILANEARQRRIIVARLMPYQTAPRVFSAATGATFSSLM